MMPPKLVWEAGLPEELSDPKAKLRFYCLGKEDPDSDDIVGWFVMLMKPDGEAKLLLKQHVYEPRLLKSFQGIRALLRDHLPAWKSVEIPIVPELRSPEKIWEMLEDLNSTTN